MSFKSVKGDKSRTTDIKKYRDNYDLIFNKNKKTEPPKKKK